MDFNRRKSRPVLVGRIALGGDAPISIQSMTKTDTREAGATVAQIHALAEAGCDIVRCAIPDMKAARALGEIVKESPIPVVADIHFNYKLALEAIARGAAKIRLNPGNLRRPEEVEAVIKACLERGIPIRIGVNAGSLAPEMRERYEVLHERWGRASVKPAGENLSDISSGVYRTPLPLVDQDNPNESMDELQEATARAMVDSAFTHIRLLEKQNFHDIVVSLKAFDVPTTLRANRLLAEQCNYPIHLGITEAGRPPAGLIRSSVGLGILLAEGIGDTLRVSLTADPIEEVRAGREILSALNLRQSGLVIVSCPTCGRCEVDLSALAIQAEEKLAPLDAKLRKAGRRMQVAIMGCVVNGPGEAKDADVGLAAGKGKAAVFSHGELIGSFAVEEALKRLVEEAEKGAE